MNKYTFIGNGRNKDFYFTFPFFSKGDIVVEINGSSATGYGVFCIQGTNNNDFPFTGGHIHFATAPKSTDIVTIERKLQFNRLIDYQTTASLNPITINQDMNYFFELLKDIKNSLSGFEETYAELTDTESTQVLIAKIDAMLDEIENLGDITTIRTSITNLGTTITNLTNSLDTLSSTVSGHTTNIGTLDTRTTGMLDYIIASQTPTADNNYTWYRKYKSGWVEQGGKITNADSQTVNIPITMSDTNYHVIVTQGETSKNPNYTIVYGNRTTTGFNVYMSYNNTTFPSLWQVSGIAAE